MPQPVFISYARDTSRAHAEALHQALGGRTAFLDTADIAPGERFPEALVDALFSAKVVVIFAEPHYFTRWYCLLEFRIARTPFLRVAGRSDATQQEKEDALRGLVVAIPARGVNPMTERFPPLVRARNWPDVENIEEIARLVDAELLADPPTLRERHASVEEAEAARSFLLEATRLPEPQRIGDVPFVPQVGLPQSIGEEFVGRADDLWRIHDLLWTERGDPATAAGLTGSIEAIGGFGKTRLALEYLYRFGPRYFEGGLFWINAESDAELQLYDVLQALDPDTPDITIVRQRPAGVPGAVARAIRARKDAPTPLFIIDNVPEPEPGQPPKPLETWCPVLHDVPVLTTSRTRVALVGGRVFALPIETLDPESAVQLLSAEAQPDALSADEWNEIAAWVGYLPLALEVLNRLLRSGEMAPRALLDLSRGERPSVAVDRAMESIRHVVPAGALRGITEAFSASYERLTSQEQYAARLIAWMAPAPIPMFVIDAFGPEVFAPGVRSKLISRSLVTQVTDGSADFFGTMHRVLADFIRGQSPAPEAEIGAVASLLRAQMKSGAEGALGSARMRSCAPLFLSFAANWLAVRSDEDGMIRVGSFATHAASALWDWGHHALAAELFGWLASASARRFGDEYPGALASWANLAMMYRELGNYEQAKQLQERILEPMRRALGPDHVDTLGTINNLAVTRYELGDYAGAAELYAEVLARMRSKQGDEHPMTLTALSNLALVRRDQGELSVAHELLEQVLEGRRRVLGEEHRDTLASMSNLANTLGKRGERARSRELREHVYASLRTLLGDEHPHTLSAMHNLAESRRVMGDHAGAQELEERVLEARRRLLGDEHPETLFSMGNLAATLRQRGLYADAQDLQERVMESMRRTLGPDHPRTLTAINSLAGTRGMRGDYRGAEELLEQVLATRQRILGDGHPDTLSSMHDLASMRGRQGDAAGAVLLLEHVLEARRQIYGDEHPSTLMTMSELAIGRRGLGDDAAAQELQEQVLEARRRFQGPEHPGTLNAMSQLALTLRSRGDLAGAQELQEHALEASCRVLGAEHPSTTGAAWSLFRTYLAGNHLDAAGAVLFEHMMWLIDRDPESLAEPQQRIQSRIRAALQGEPLDDGDGGE